MIEILQAETPEQIEETKKLFREYEKWLELDTCFQGFKAELADLPRKYAKPNGRLFITSVAGKIAGCIALRKFRRKHLRNETALSAR